MEKKLDAKSFKIPEWFPAKGKTCVYKWSQVCVYLWEGMSSSCHRNKNFPIPSDFDFHNTPEVMEDRKLMLENKWPNKGRGCEHCRDQEDKGGISDRMQQLREYNKRFVSQEMKENPSAVKIQPTQVSVNFNNKCNCKCIYCGPELSSSWVKELKNSNSNNRLWGTSRKKHNKMFNSNEPWKLDTTYNKRQKQFKLWMEKNYKNLKAFDILGGEPMIQPETFDTIDFMIKNPNLELDFEIYSNMQVKPKIFRERIKKVQELSTAVKEVVWVASIDCWGPESEYIRKGHDIKTWEENYLYLLEECKEIIPSMNWSLTCLSIKNMHELMEKVIVWNNNYRHSAVNINKVIDPKCLDPNIFVKGTFKKEIKKILELYLIMCKHNISYYNYLTSMLKEIDSNEYDTTQVSQNTNNVAELIRYLEELDSRRKTNWKKTFPWLVEIINEKYRVIYA